MSKGYIVMESGTEYNDEVYSITEGGTPTRVFLDKTKAENHRDELLLEKLKDGFNFGEYGYETRELSGRGHKDTVAIWNTIVPEKYHTTDNEESYYAFKTGKEFTLEMASKLSKLFKGLTLFYIEEVEVES